MEGSFGCKTSWKDPGSTWTNQITVEPDMVPVRVPGSRGQREYGASTGGGCGQRGEGRWSNKGNWWTVRR